jgi:hypothetical protein
VRLCILAVALLSLTACGGRSDLPSGLNDQQFWRLFETFSEPGRSVGLSDNFVSNEPRVAENARWLASSGGVYIGVGPEQNFTYIARQRPAMAFIVDIRRENADLHLLYKALFELSRDRAEFVSRLFSRPVRQGLGEGASVAEIFERVDEGKASTAQLAESIALVRERLMTMHHFPLQEHDLASIDRALHAFAEGGPALHYWGAQAVDSDILRPSYERLMTMPDMTGKSRSFLASESAFRFVQDMHRHNLVVPVVGDFGGNGALRRVADYVREHHGVVRAFYGSNVAVYLTNQQMRVFCGNLSALPAARNASFVDSDSVIPLAARLQSCPR